MEPFHLAHLVVLGMWLGVVITEVLFEFAGSDATVYVVRVSETVPGFSKETRLSESPRPAAVVNALVSVVATSDA
jgi:hypothetical protein